MLDLAKRSGGEAAQGVFSALLAAIIAFELKPYEELSEASLALQMGVSRTPVREALARLAKLRLVDIYPQRGTSIAPLRLRDLVSSQFLRESLEIGLLRRAMKSAGRAKLADVLMAEIKVQEALAAIGDEQRFYAADEMFHRSIYASAGLQDIGDYIADAKVHMDRFRHLMLSSVENLPIIVGQHKAIADAVAAGNEAAAERAMKIHLRRIFSFVESAFAAHPEYFEDKQLSDVLPGVDDDLLPA